MSNSLIQTISLKDDGYSKNIKSAQQALHKLAQENGVANTSFRNASREMNAAKRYATTLTVEYEKLSDAAKHSQFGRELKAQIDQAKAAAANMSRISKQVQADIEGMGKSAKGVSLKDAFKNLSSSLGSSISSSAGGLLGNIGGLAKVGAPLAAAAAGVALVGTEFVKSSKHAMEFEKSMSNLSAITGISGKDLDALQKQIQNTGFETSKSFQTIADSYTLVGSKMPELLKQPKALDEVTRAVITLSKAAGMDLQAATESLTGIMNQMGANASEAEKYINVLAAGSKEGAGNIEYLSQAMDKCGTSVSSAGLSIEQGTALLEVLAQKIPDASTAGTNLRNILLKMMQASDKFNPKIVGMQEALENLSKKVNDTTFMVKMFGSENVNAATTLAQCVDKYADLTNKVTGTDEALKQAGVQTQNLQSQLAKLNQDWENLTTGLNKSNGALSTMVGLLDKAIVGWTQLLGLQGKMPTWDDYGNRGASKAQEEINAAKKAAMDSNANADKAVEAYKATLRQKQAQYQRMYENAISMGVDAKDKKTQEQFYNEAHGYKTTADALAKALKQAINPNDFKPTKTSTPVSNTTNTNKTKSPKEIWEEKISETEALLSAGLIDEKKALEDKISATTEYIKQLNKSKGAVAKNKTTTQTLTARINAWKKQLEAATIAHNDTETIKNADKEYAATINKLNRDKENGWITESEYNTKLQSAIQTLINKYDGVSSMSDKLKSVMSKAQIELMQFKADDMARTYAQEQNVWNYKKHWAGEDYNAIKNDRAVASSLYKEQFDKEFTGWQFYPKIEQALKNNANNTQALIQWLNQHADEASASKVENNKDFNFKYLEYDLGGMLHMASYTANQKVDEAKAQAQKEGKTLDDKQIAEIQGEAIGKDIADTLGKYIEVLKKGGDATAYGNKMQSSDFQGDKSTYGLNVLSVDKLNKEVNGYLSSFGQTSYDALQNELGMLMDKYQKLLDAALAKFAAGWTTDDDIKNLETDLNNLKESIIKKRNEIEPYLKFDVTIEGIEDLAGATQSVMSCAQEWENLGDTLDGCKTGFDEFVTVINVLINTFETVVGVVKSVKEAIELFNTVTQTSTMIGDQAAQHSTANTAQEVANAGAQTAAKSGEAVADATASGAELPFPYNIVAIAAGVAAVLSAIAMISSFANGGIVDSGFVNGSSYHGDSTLIRANKGELVLNQHQQKNLMTALNGAALGGGVNGNVKFEIKGSNLVGALHNYKNTKGKVGARTI